MHVHDDYLDAIASAGASEVSHISLIDDSDEEVTDRQSVTWDENETGTIRPDEDMTFDVSSGDTVAGWRGWDDSSGGTEMVGADLPEESFDNDGQYTLLADDTGVIHQLGS